MFHFEECSLKKVFMDIFAMATTGQGDQIGIIFAHWVIVISGSFLILKITERLTFLGHFFHGKGSS
jgi:hypothetical protein